MGPGNFDGVFKQTTENFPAFRSADPDAEAEIVPLRIAADEGFGKDDELGPLVRGVGNEVGEFLQGSRKVEQDRSGLHHRASDQLR